MINNFIIFTTQRTGSNYLGTLLSSHAQINYYGEVFKDKGNEIIQTTNYFNFIKNHLIQKILYRLKLKFLVAKNFYLFISKQKKNKDIITIGYKLMLSQLNNNKELLNVPKNTLIIKLKRKNLLEKHISRLSARESQQWILRSSDKRMNSNLKLNTEKLISSLNSLKEEDKAIDLLFSNYKTLTLFYEDLVENRDKTLFKILNLLNLDLNTNLKSDLIKQNNLQLNEKIINFDEVSKTLKGTEFENILK